MIGQSGIAIRSITRADPTALAQLAQFGVATMHEAMGRSGLLASYMRPIYPGAKVCGTAVTIFAHPGDNWMLHVAAELLQARRHCGARDLLRQHRRHVRRVVGHVISRARRARSGHRRRLPRHRRTHAMKFPVWSRAVHAKGTVKATVGSVNTPIMCAGALVHPGDVVIGDDDGVVIVPKLRAAAVAAAAAVGKPRKRRLASAWRPANWVWTYTACANRWPRRALSISPTRPPCSRSRGSECEPPRIR